MKSCDRKTECRRTRTDKWIQKFGQRKPEPAYRKYLRALTRLYLSCLSLFLSLSLSFLFLFLSHSHSLSHPHRKRHFRNEPACMRIYSPRENGDGDCIVFHSRLRFADGILRQQTCTSGIHLYKDELQYLSGNKIRVDCLFYFFLFRG